MLIWMPKEPIRIVAALCMTSLLFVGCATTKGPPSGAVPTDRQLASWLRKSKDPSLFWVRMGLDETNEPIYDNANRVGGSKYTELAFAKTKSALPIPVIEVPGRDGDFRILFDTSSRYSFVDFDTAGILNAIPLSIRSLRLRPKHVNDPRDSYRTLASVFKIGNIRVDSAALAVRPMYGSLGPVGRGVQLGKGRPNATLGNEIQAQFRAVHYDFPRRRVVLSTTLPYTIEPDSGAVTVPLRIYSGGSTVPVSIAGGETRGAILDTVGNYALALPEGGGKPVSLRIGELVFDAVPTVSTSSQNFANDHVPRIGLHLLQQYRVTLEHTPNPDGGAKEWRCIFEEPYQIDDVPAGKGFFGKRGSKTELEKKAP